MLLKRILPIQNISIRYDVNRYVPDQFGTLAQVGTSPNLGWPNKELRGSQPIYELFCPSWDPLGIPIKQSGVFMLVSFLEVQGNGKWRNVLLRNAAQ